VQIPAEHAGPRGFRCRRAVLAAVVAPASPGVVSHRRPCFRVAFSVGVDDVKSVAVLSLSTRVKDLLPDRRSALVGWSPCRAICKDRCLPALSVAIVPRTA
jgi:hypothetical protein